MTLSSCCQQVLLDHYPECDARHGTQPSAPTSGVRQCRACPHSEVLHSIRSNGSRGSCSISAGVAAEPCGCPGFAPAEPAPTPEEGGPQL